jgi:hypothetical protein
MVKALYYLWHNRLVIVTYGNIGICMLILSYTGNWWYVLIGFIATILFFRISQEILFGLLNKGWAEENTIKYKLRVLIYNDIREEIEHEEQIKRWHNR